MNDHFNDKLCKQEVDSTLFDECVVNNRFMQILLTCNI